jgi:hypothetical protein
MSGAFLIAQLEQTTPSSGRCCTALGAVTVYYYFMFTCKPPACDKSHAAYIPYIGEFEEREGFVLAHLGLSILLSSAAIAAKSTGTPRPRNVAGGVH